MRGVTEREAAVTVGAAMGAWAETMAEAMAEGTQAGVLEVEEAEERAGAGAVTAVEG